MLENLQEFSRTTIAGHPGLFDPDYFPSDLFRAIGEKRLLGAPDVGTIARGSALIALETGSLGLATVWTEQSLIPLVLEKSANLPEKVKAGLPTGETIIVLAISEPNAGSHPKLLKTTATKVNGGWKLDGEKAYTTSGPIASHIAVLAITDTSAGRKAYSFFLVPANTEGLTRVEHPQYDFLRPAQHCGFKLNNCIVPDSALIGRPGKGYEDVALPFRNIEDAAGSGSLVGVLKRAGRRAAGFLSSDVSDETAAALGEMAGIEAAMEALNHEIVALLEEWDTESDAMNIRLVAIRDLAKHYAEILSTIITQDDEHVSRILKDVVKTLDIGRTARQIRKARLGRSSFLTTI